MKPRIAVLMPVYNEEKYIKHSLMSLLRQTIKPELIIVGDNESADNSARIARRILNRDENIEGLVVTIKRYPELGKLNINHVYYFINKILDLMYGLEQFDYIATIEADTVLETEYFKKVLKTFEKDPKLCITAGKLEPLGILKDSFPFGLKGIVLWGSNRVYRACCWTRLNELVDIRCLPAWDTDHVILALLLGYHVYYTPVAKSYHIKLVTPIRGFHKGWVDAAHGLPAWWAMFKTLQKRNIDYFRGYLSTLASVRGCRDEEFLYQLRLVYKVASTRAFIAYLMKRLGFKA
ncbi:MAG: glycosyltransferase family A protein [Sulfolobales archaeon]